MSSISQRLLILAFLSTLLILSLFFGTIPRKRHTLIEDDNRNESLLPDFGHYVLRRNVSQDELRLGKPGRRLIAIGDIHGMDKALRHLLHKISYNSSSDTLIHLGDITQKGSLTGILDVLSFLSSHNALGVRGNHDQEVVQWRAWIEWIESAKGGKSWLHDVERRWKRQRKEDDDVDLEDWLEEEEKKAKRHGEGKWWKRIPDDWEMLGEHYRIARAITREHYQYLLSLPLVLHIPSQHMFLVHAGLLPYDLRHPADDSRQPLAHLPSLQLNGIEGSRASLNEISSELDEETMRTMQEEALLTGISYNTDPWVLLNIRSIKHGHKISRDAGEGKSWAKVWNEIMKRCDGFDTSLTSMQESQGKDHGGKLPCMPSTVVYGHTAARGLDLHRWSMGLDTGCAHGRRLTALVLGENLKAKRADIEAVDDGSQYAFEVQAALDEDEDVEADLRGDLRKDKIIPFGDDGTARIIRVKCHA